MDDGTVRLLTEEDETRVIDLHRRAFPHARRSAEHQRWKYTGNPFGPPIRVGVFDREGTLAAHAGAYAVPMLRFTGSGVRPAQAMQAGDSMADPRFRGHGHGRLGVFARAMQRLLDATGEAGMDRLYGVAHRRLIRFYLRNVQGCERLFGVPHRVCPVRRGRLEASGPPIPSSADRYTIAESQRPDQRCDALLERVAPDYGILTRRDAAYLEWRYRRCPDQRYLIAIAAEGDELAGWGVFRRDDDDLLWGDALFDPLHLSAARPLLEWVLSRDRMRGVERVCGWFRERPDWWARAIGDLGLAPEPEPQGLEFVDGCHADAPSGNGLTSEELRASLYVTMGDSDLF